MLLLLLNATVVLHQLRLHRVTVSLTVCRFQQQLCLDHLAVQRSSTGPAFSSLKDAVRRLLPYHTCSGHLPTEGDFNLGQWDDSRSIRLISVCTLDRLCSLNRPEL